MRIHQDIASELIFVLKNSLEENECPNSEVSFENDGKVSNNTTLRPDIVLVCNDEGKAYLTKAPKIIIEILSPSTAKKMKPLNLTSMKKKKFNTTS